jgi:hypothetical protein
MLTKVIDRLGRLCAFFAAVVVSVSVAGCGASVSNEEKQAAIERCVAKQSNKLTSPQISGNPTPEMRAQIEAAAKQTNDALAKMSRGMCEKTVTETCKQSASACKKLVSGG